MSVISSDTRPVEALQDNTMQQPSLRRRKLFVFRMFLIINVLLTCIGTGWFAFQYFLVPQSKEFAPDWQGAQWVQATDTVSPIAYFRYATTFNVLPDSAFVTVTANQVFRLYVNGYYIGANTSDFVQGDTPQAYMFDIDSALQPGSNVIGFRVANVDNQTPTIRANVGVMWGGVTHYYSTGNGWQATGLTALAHPRYETSNYAWATSAFDASSWSTVQEMHNPPASPMLTVNPRVYEQPLPTHWLSAGVGHESYFVRQVTVPSGFDEAFLRLIATGDADVFINGHLYMTWKGQVVVPNDNFANYLSYDGTPALYRIGLVLGVYDITPYLHVGTNTIAVHVLSPGSGTARVGLDTLKSAMSLDMLVGVSGTYTAPLALDADWHTSSSPVANWTEGGGATSTWRPPIPVGRPGESRTFYLPDSNTPRNVQVIPPILMGEVLLGSVAAVLAVWLFMALAVLRSYYRSRREALEATSLAFLPALVLEALLLTLAREPDIPQPFPYTWQWAVILIFLVACGYLLLWFHARRAKRALHEEKLVLTAYKQANVQHHQPRTFKQRVSTWLQQNWGLIPILLLAIPMISYNIGYDPYWQDELSSYYAARGIMAHGIPVLPSGFIYPKAELFSYTLAFVMALFGDGNGVPRMISMVEYIVTIPLLYIIGSAMFNRRIAWFATAMLALSPYTLLWGRQARMYEQAQMMTLIVLFAFYRAIYKRDRVLPVFLAVIALLIAYFSHEETFMIMPAILVCVFVGSREGPYGLPAVLRKKHWWLGAALAAVVIGTQLAIVFLSHPPRLGGDQSQRPQIQLTLNNIPFYFYLLFVPKALKDGATPWIVIQPLIVLNSLLATGGCVLAFLRKNRPALYCALFLVVSLLTLTFVFTMQADRYFYPLLPVYYLLGAYAFWSVLRYLWRFARPYLARPVRDEYTSVSTTRSVVSLPMKGMLLGVVGLLMACVLITPMLPLSNYNLLVSRITGLSYHRHFADYDNVGNYMHSHLQKGDIVITVAPAVSVLYYVGQVDNYFSIDHALFLIEQNGRLVETTSGSHPLLNQADFQTVLANHARIWLITDNGGYQAGVVKDNRFTFPPPDFRLVYEGFGSAVYFRSNGG